MSLMEIAAGLGGGGEGVSCAWVVAGDEWEFECGGPAGATETGDESQWR